ncbi:ABC-2 family transporter protein [Maioricimonas rarisocia]|uniref:ABC-2 family transporter protein n=1 Tax=Maioricimonas rarisocia TaxID=2528026 RepID=A0A517Z4R6_9PLAN|nr:ABC transporter permease [Maioricimonas rarisocia]QDU37492.1 ABC-2 family transporter protein [Maioricimonas rarisocia]
MSNPIVTRELLSFLRRPGALWLQCGLAVVFVLLVVLRWPTDAHVAMSGTRSQEVFRIFAYGLLAAMLLVLPGFPATSIVRERNQGTLALLLGTPLGGSQILQGKLLATMLLALLLLSLSLPAVAASYALGGVSLSGISGAYGLLLATALGVTSLGLLVSSYSISSDGAVRWTYGLVLLWSVVSLVPHHFFAGAEGITGTAVEWLRCVSPIAALMAWLGAGDLGMRGVATEADIPARFVLLSVGMSILLTLWTLARMNQSIFDRSRSAGMIADEQSTGVQVLRRMFFIVDPRRRSSSIGPLVNPVMVKEFRCRRFGRLHWLLRLVAACAVLSLALSILTTTRTINWDVPTIGGVMVLLQVALLVLITPSLTSGLISTERETGGWVLLQMTPMSIGRIVWGKLLSVMLTLALVLCATLPGYLVMVYIEPGQRLEVQRVVVCLLITAIFAMLASAAVGSLFRKTAAATAAAYVTLLAICAAPLLVWLGRDAPFGHDTVEAALTINPVAAALSVIHVQGFQGYDLIPANWWFLGIASAASLLLMLLQTWRISRPA